MIIILHYILFSAGMPAVTILQALFLQTHSAGTLTEIGILCMILPFLSIVVKPLVCGLADRQQAHKQYLIGCLTFMLLGYGSLAIAPFFPDFVHTHGRLVWYLDVVGVIIGNMAYGVVWSLGDALAVQRAAVMGVSWGSYRAWATLSWGVFGYFVGQVNEVSFLPKYVPGILILVCATFLEIILVCLWSDEHFDMSIDPFSVPNPVTSPTGEQATNQPTAAASAATKQSYDESLGEISDSHWANSSVITGFPGGTAGFGGNSLNGTLTGSVRTNPRLMSALANIVVGDIGSSLRSNLKLGAPVQNKRSALADILEQHKLHGVSPAGSGTALAGSAGTGLVAASGDNNSPDNVSRHSSSLQHSSGSPTPQNSSNQAINRSAASQETGISTSGAGPAPQRRPSSATVTLGRAALRKTQLMLSRMNSLSSASGLVILDDMNAAVAAGDTLLMDPANQQQSQSQQNTPSHQHQVMVMSSLASNASLSRAAAARTMGFASRPFSSKDSAGSFDVPANQQQQQQHRNSLAALEESNQEVGALQDTSNQPATVSQKTLEQLQLVLLKLIIRHDPMIHKYLVLFTLTGILLFVHILYFFLHVEQIAHANHLDFSEISGYLMVAQSISEIATFLFFVPHIMPLLGRTGSFVAAALVLFIRFSYYASPYFVKYSIYYAFLTEILHGIAFGLTYSLITDIACDCVNQVDIYVPELLARGLIQPDMNTNVLKLPLRATMQGLFSGAFDGFGNGLGALSAGIYAETHPYADLWTICSYLSLAIVIIYPIVQWREFIPKKKNNNNKETAKSSKTTKSVSPI